MRKNDVIGIACADIHLSMAAPLARSKEPNWFDAMRRPLNALGLLAKEYKVPILCAGDIFDQWKVPPELINFALDALPDNVLVVPGQHDLPLHSMEDIHKSAFWTLVKAKKVTMVSPEGLTIARDVVVHGHGWKAPLYVPSRTDGRLHVAMVHEYTWTKGAKYPGAPEEQRVSDKYTGYSTVIIGDNHKPFDSQGAGCYIFNCGGFMRRKSDEVNHKPRVGIIYRSGHVVTKHLDTSFEVFNETAREDSPVNQNNGTLSDFLRDVKNLQAEDLNFRSAVLAALKAQKITEAVRTILLEALED